MTTKQQTSSNQVQPQDQPQNAKGVKRKLTKKGQVLDHLQQFGSITSREAITLFWATRLSDIIFKLRNEGHILITTRYPNKNGGGTYAVYNYEGWNGKYTEPK